MEPIGQEFTARMQGITASPKMSLLGDAGPELLQSLLHSGTFLTSLGLVLSERCCSGLLPHPQPDGRLPLPGPVPQAGPL